MNLVCASSQHGGNYDKYENSEISSWRVARDIVFCQLLSFWALSISDIFVFGLCDGEIAWQQLGIEDKLTSSALCYTGFRRASVLFDGLMKCNDLRYDTSSRPS